MCEYTVAYVGWFVRAQALCLLARENAHTAPTHVPSYLDITSTVPTIPTFPPPTPPFQVGARGQDEWGVLFSSSMKRLGVDIGSLVTREGCPTARCCILTTPAGGQRTMRTAMAGAARLEAREVVPAAFAGASWAFVSAYALYVPGVLEATVDAARAAGCLVALDLASFEVVRAQRDAIVALLDSGRVALCFANEDEACALVDKDTNDEFAHLEGLAFAAARCSVGGVVTLGEKGCVVRAHGSEAVVAQPAVSGVKLVDATGAGDLFAAGFLYGLLTGAGLAHRA